MTGRTWWTIGGGLVFVPIVGLTSLHTSPGRDALRWAAQTSARAVLPGALYIGAVEGSLFGTLRIRDVQLVDVDGVPAAEAALLEVEHDVGALLAGQIHVLDAAVTALRIDVPRLRRALPAAAPGGRAEPFAIRVDRARLDAARIIIDRDVTVDDLQLVASATVSGPAVAAHITALGGRLLGHRFEAQGGVAWSGDRIRRLNLSLRYGDVALHLGAVKTATGAWPIDGRVRWPDRALDGWLEAALGIPGPADLAVRLRGNADRLSFGVHGRLFGADVRATAYGPRPPWRANLVARGLDPRRLNPRAPRGRLTVSATATVGAAQPTGPPWPDGQLTVRAHGRLHTGTSTVPVRISRLWLRADSSAGAIGTHLRLRSSMGAVHARLRGRWRQGQPHLERGRLHLQDVRLGGVLAPFGGQGSGTMSATVTASGPLAHPRIRAAVTGRRLRAPAATADRVDASVDWVPDPDRPRATIRGRVTGLRRGQVNLSHGRFAVRFDGARPVSLTVTATGAHGPIRGLTLAGRVAAGESQHTFAWSTLTLRTPRARWRLRPGRVVRRGHRLRIPTIDIRSTNGAMRGHLDVDLRAPLGPQTSMALGIDHLDLETLTGLHPALDPPPPGELTAQIAFDGARPKLRLEAKLSGFRGRPTWPQADAQLTARMTPDHVTVAGAAYGQPWGRLQVDARGRPPVRWRSVKAWTEPLLNAVRSLKVGFDVNLDRLPLLTDAAPGLTGRVFGRVSIGPGARSSSVQVQASEVSARDIPTLKRLSLSASGANDSLEARLRAEVGDHRASSVVARLRHGLPELLHGVRWSDLRGQFRADVVGLPLELLGLRVADQRRPVSGSLTVRARGGQAADGPLLVGFARASDVRLGPKLPPMTLATLGRVERRTATATATLSAPELGRHRIAVRVRVPGRPLAIDATLFDRLISLSMRSDGLALSTFGGLGLGPPSLRGHINARLFAGPALSTFSATVAAQDVTVSPAIAPLDLQARVTDSGNGLWLSARSRLGEADFVSATARLPVGLRALLGRGDPTRVPVSATITSDRFPLARALLDAADRRDVRGRLIANATIRGPMVAPDVRASLTVDGLRLGPVRFRHFGLQHDLRHGQMRMAATVEQAGGGTMRARVDRSGRDVRASLDARGFRLGFMSALANLTDAGAAVNGTVDGALSLHGRTDDPKLSGALRARDVRLAVPNVPSVENGRVDVWVAGQRVDMNMAAASGTGRIFTQLTGHVPSLSDARLRGTFALDDVPIVTGDRILRVKLGGRLAAHRSNGGVDAEVVLREGIVRLPDVTPRPLHGLPSHDDLVFRQGRWRPLSPAVDAAPSPPRLTVRVRSSAPLAIRGQPVQATLDLDLVAKRRAGGTTVAGNVRVHQGTVTLFGRRYTVDRAKVMLSGRVDASPRLDVRLSHKFDACTFFVGLVGSAEAPRVVLSAQPDIYDDKQLFAFLFGASPDGDQYDKTPAQQGLDLAAWLLLEEVQTRLRRALPFDTLAVDLGEGTQTGRANVTLGKWLTDRLFLAYAYHHGAARDENTSEGLLRYRFLGTWLLEMVFGDRGNGGADLMWTRRW